MAQVLIDVHPGAFISALRNNIDRREQIRSATHDTITLCKNIDRALTVAAVVSAEGNDKRGGFLVVDGELQGLHSIDKGNGDWLLRAAVEQYGANRLDTFDIPNLMALYTRHGFHEVLREPNINGAGPDVIWMRRD